MKPKLWQNLNTFSSSYGRHLHDQTMKKYKDHYHSSPFTQQSSQRQ